MNSNHTVVDLTSVPIPLASGPYRLTATLGRAGLIDATDRLGMSMLSSNDLLAPISQPLFVPFNRFKKAL